jgi:hypothetical protein
MYFAFFIFLNSLVNHIFCEILAGSASWLIFSHRMETEFSFFFGGGDYIEFLVCTSIAFSVCLLFLKGVRV